MRMQMNKNQKSKLVYLLSWYPLKLNSKNFLFDATFCFDSPEGPRGIPRAQRGGNHK
jgi:hypothetical protein